ncbi:MAG: AAA family ATPase [Candidatus Hermodarchaeota archaeon]
MNSTARIGLGFDLQKIGLYRFMNYHTPVTFNFKAPNIVIAGPTGSGKSTILDALTFVLFGKSSRLDLQTVKIEDICNKNGRVLCQFRIGENVVRIKRGRDQQGKSYLELFIDGDRVPGKIPELNEKIRSTILGMNYQSFVNSTIIRQDEMKALGSKSSAERLRTLQNLFRLDIFEKAIRDVQIRLQEVLNKKNQKEGELKAKIEEISKIDQLEKELTKVKPQIINKRQKHNSLLEAIEKLRKTEKEQQTILEKYLNIQATQENAQIRLRSKQEDLIEASKELESYQKLQKQLSELDTQIKKAKNLEEEIRVLEGLEEDYELINNHLNLLERKSRKKEETLEKDLKQKLKRLKKEQERTKDLSTSIDHETAFKILNQEGRLLERIQRISLEQSWNLSEKLLQELRNEQLKAREDLKELQKEKENINQDSFVLSEISQRINELEEEVQELESRLKQEKKSDDEELCTERKKLKKLDFSTEKKQRLATLRNEHESNQEIKEKYEIIREKTENKVDPTSKVVTIENQVKEVIKEIDDLRNSLKGFPTFRKEFDTLIENLETKEKEERALDKEITVLEERKKNLIVQIKELKQLKPEIIGLQEEVKTLVKEEEILEKLKNEVFHTKGAPFYAINKVLPRLGKRASLILAELTNNRFSNLQLQKVESGRQGMGFEILVKVPEGVRDIATFSGGERTQINAALRLAISEEISELGRGERIPSATKKTLFIDEGDLGSLDTLEAQQAFVKKLFQLTNKFKIILITHLQEIADQFPHSINITRDNYGRSIKGEETSSL